ncbi:MAG TPA: DUF4142 domain-containing protein [Abditibacteriaceae bacterium]|nr:DUF4142 domain-containing protein [Abditibacteriaceae bacterium]
MTQDNLTTNQEAEVVEAEVMAEPNSRRAFLGCVAFAGLGAALLGTTSAAEALPLPARANNERQYRTKLMAVATVSRITSQLALNRATATDVLAFANFELNEANGVLQVLREMGTVAPPPDAQDRAIIASLRNSRGVAFERTYTTAQYQAHVFLRNLGTDYVRNSRSRGNRTQEGHTRHIAMLSLPTINEHIAHTQSILRRMGA